MRGGEIVFLRTSSCSQRSASFVELRVCVVAFYTCIDCKVLSTRQPESLVVAYEGDVLDVGLATGSFADGMCDDDEQSRVKVFLQTAVHAAGLLLGLLKGASASSWRLLTSSSQRTLFGTTQEQLGSLCYMEPPVAGLSAASKWRTSSSHLEV